MFPLMIVFSLDQEWSYEKHLTTELHEKQIFEFTTNLELAYFSFYSDVYIDTLKNKSLNI